mmetsp:Transcript_20201/g.22521  ORF Transcript_20201/g.22521 Transcript_20201/m.22521 type:complete len:167 (+) Transcript_20201:223-723(+)
MAILRVAEIVNGHASKLQITLQLAALQALSTGIEERRNAFGITCTCSTLTDGFPDRTNGQSQVYCKLRIRTDHTITNEPLHLCLNVKNVDIARVEILSCPGKVGNVFTAKQTCPTFAAHVGRRFCILTADDAVGSGTAKLRGALPNHGGIVPILAQSAHFIVIRTA